MALTDSLIELVAPFNAAPTLGLIILLIWVIVWKGLALWKAARLTQPVWFIILLVVNTMGILEILYIFIFSKLSFNRTKMKKKKKK